MDSIPLEDKINWRKQVGEMLYGELSGSALTITKAKKMLEKACIKVKQEKANSRALHLLNEYYKELIIKLGVNPEEKTIVESIIQGSQFEIQELRQKLKMLAYEHVQSK